MLPHMSFETTYSILKPRVLLALLVVAMVGCNEGPTKPSVPASTSTQWVVVAIFSWDQREEENEIFELFRTNGITASGSGSKRAGILVPQQQAEFALTLLKTNHLVTTGKIVLLVN